MVGNCHGSLTRWTGGNPSTSSERLWVGFFAQREGRAPYLTNRLRWVTVLLEHRERFGKPNPATCRWRRQGALIRKGRCAGERSPERESLHGTFRRLMKVGGFFVLLVRPKHQPEEQKIKSEGTYRNRVVRSVNRWSHGSGPCYGILPKGRHLRGAPLAQRSQQQDQPQLVCPWERQPVYGRSWNTQQ
jgi:hypothetical protein